MNVAEMLPPMEAFRRRIDACMCCSRRFTQTTKAHRGMAVTGAGTCFFLACKRCYRRLQRDPKLVERLTAEAENALQFCARPAEGHA